jgi:hypothetical protein
MSMPAMWQTPRTGVTGQDLPLTTSAKWSFERLLDFKTRQKASLFSKKRGD